MQTDTFWRSSVRLKSSDCCGALWAVSPDLFCLSKFCCDLPEADLICQQAIMTSYQSHNSVCPALPTIPTNNTRLIEHTVTPQQGKVLSKSNLESFESLQR